MLRRSRCRNNKCLISPVWEGSSSQLQNCSVIDTRWSFCWRIKPELMNRTHSTGQVKEIYIHTYIITSCSELKVRSCFCLQFSFSTAAQLCSLTVMTFVLSHSDFIDQTFWLRKSDETKSPLFCVSSQLIGGFVWFVVEPQWWRVDRCETCLNTRSLDGCCCLLISNLSVGSDKWSFFTWSNWLFWFF